MKRTNAILFLICILLVVTGCQKNTISLEKEGIQSIESMPLYDYKELEYYYHAYDIRIKGVSYSVDNYASETRTTYTSAGAGTGILLIKSDGTYQWDSTWDHQLHKGTWEYTGEDFNEGYPILLRNGESGKDWKVGIDTSGYGAHIIVWDGEGEDYVGLIRK